MARTYFIIDNKGTEKGPLELNLIKKNGINRETMAWFYGLPFWVKAETIPEFTKYLKNSGIESREDLPELNLTNDSHKKIILKNIYASDLDKQKIAQNSQPKSWLLASILTTIFCFLPFGIMGIINAARVKALWKAGHYAESINTAIIAKWWVKWGVIIAVIFWATCGIYMVLFPSVLSTARYLLDNLSNSLYTN